jgi:transcriptional regulator with XRE-family HTH domain
MFDEQLGEAVHRVLWRRHISQTDFARVLGITQSALSLKLRGQRPFFAQELRMVADVLEINLDELAPHVDVAPFRAALVDTSLPRLDSNQQPFACLAA